MDEMTTGIGKNFVRMLVIGFGVGNTARMSGGGDIAYMLGVVFGALMFMAVMEHAYHSWNKSGKTFTQTVKSWGVSSTFVIVPMILFALIGAMAYPVAKTVYSGETKAMSNGEIYFEIPVEMHPDANVAEMWGADQAYRVNTDSVAVRFGEIEGGKDVAIAAMKEEFDATPEVMFSYETVGDTIETTMYETTEGITFEIKGKIMECGNNTYFILYTTPAEKSEEMTKKVMDSIHCE